MDDNCIFCKIIAGEMDGSVVYEGEHVVAFMDINQPNHYKVLVCTRRHAPMIYDINDEEAAEVMQVSRRVARAIQQITNCPGMNVFQNNGKIAYQDVFHFHLHLMPRYEGDDRRRRNVESREVLDKLAADLRGVLE